MEQDNEKIIYDIEVRTKIDEAQQELRKLKQELKTNNREELLVNLKIVGGENFKSIKQNLSEVRKAIEILEKHNSTTLTLNGAGFDCAALRSVLKSYGIVSNICINKRNGTAILRSLFL